MQAGAVYLQYRYIFVFDGKEINGFTKKIGIQLLKADGTSTVQVRYFTVFLISTPWNGDSAGQVVLMIAGILIYFMKGKKRL